MRGTRTGVGLVFGAGLGLVLGQVLLDQWWIGLMIGSAAGLVVGAVADLLKPPDSPRRRAPDDGVT